ncbi:DHHA1 domain-containing protein [Salinirubellus salinus]|uniref:DHHA1 domain-containing protein n=1 Tax=Salinirubellus salinus TaxID=1364945 RepID=A0A9E7UAT2_9EURY|nr:DHHA1 domain-containing protein [Salinirubellus salinus]UWM54377.1 DHHA1 domain-containing protein [Salinirubellus salinus]
MTTSRDWDAGAFETDADDSADTARRALLNSTTDVANVPLEEVPEQFGRLQDRVAEQEKLNAELRATAARAWWRGLEAGRKRAEDGHDSPIYLADPPEADHEIARQVAIQAVEHDRGVVVAVGREDGSVSVGVGGNLSDTVSAIEVAREVLAPLDGSAGGSDELANGGGSDPEAILASAREVVDRLRVEHGAGQV